MTPTRRDVAPPRCPCRRPAILAASRSAKNRWRCACDWSPATSLHESVALAGQRLVEGQGDARCAPTAAQATGASRPRAFLASRPPAVSKASRSVCATCSRRSRTAVNCRASAASSPRANATAAATSIALERWRRQARRPAPPRRRSAAGDDHLQRLGRRRSAPAAGWCRRLPAAGRASPRAGRASRALSATRKWQPSASSSPPPSAVPWIAATVGLSIASSSAIRSRRSAAASACRTR